MKLFHCQWHAVLQIKIGKDLEKRKQYYLNKEKSVKRQKSVKKKIKTNWRIEWKHDKNLKYEEKEIESVNKDVYKSLFSFLNKTL